MKYFLILVVCISISSCVGPSRNPSNTADLGSNGNSASMDYYFGVPGELWRYDSQFDYTVQGSTLFGVVSNIPNEAKGSIGKTGNRTREILRVNTKGNFPENPNYFALRSASENGGVTAYIGNSFNDIDREFELSVRRFRDCTELEAQNKLVAGASWLKQKLDQLSIKKIQPSEDFFCREPVVKKIKHKLLAASFVYSNRAFGGDFGRLVDMESEEQIVLRFKPTDRDLEYLKDYYFKSKVMDKDLIIAYEKLIAQISDKSIQDEDLKKNLEELFNFK